VRRALTIALVAAVGLVAPGPAPASAATETSLGTPILNVGLDRVAYGTSPSGAPEFYAVPLASGSTRFHAVDIRTGATRLSLPMPNASGARDLVTAPDGSVYIATFSQGRLYRVRPGTGSIADLGRPHAGAQYLFGLAVHPDGTVFVGEYPTGKVYSYTPGAGAWRDYGQLSADSAYTRSIAVWKGSLLVGLGTQAAHLYGVNIQTGVKYEIPLPAPHHQQSEVSQVTVRGDLAYVRVAPSGALLVYDILAQTWSTAPGGSTGLDVSPVSPYATANREVYHVAGGGLKAFSPVTGQTRAIAGFTGMWTSRGFAWVSLQEQGFPDQSLVMVDYIGRMWIYNPGSGSAVIRNTQIPGAPTDIRSIAVGPEGRIWVGGLGSGGLSSYDPVTGVTQQVPRGTVGQSDEMRAAGSNLWIGVYPGANLLRYNPSQPFNWGTNPATVASLAGHEQDRPMAVAAAAGRIVVGTVPNYGEVSGAVAVHNPANGQTLVSRGISGTRSVVSLAAIGSVVYASTSKWGGLGVPPPAADGTVFAYDPVAGTKLWEVTPYPGLPAVTELAASPAGTIWGLTRGRLFELNPSTRTVVREIAVPVEDWDTVDHVWSEFQRLAVATDGTVYAQVGGRLLRVPPAATTYTQVGWANTFVLADSSTIYLARGAVLYRLDL
jgi:streptogramin lyase